MPEDIFATWQPVLSGAMEQGRDASVQSMEDMKNAPLKDLARQVQMQKLKGEFQDAPTIQKLIGGMKPVSPTIPATTRTGAVQGVEGPIGPQGQQPQAVGSPERQATPQEMYQQQISRFGDILQQGIEAEKKGNLTPTGLQGLFTALQPMYKQAEIQFQLSSMTQGGNRTIDPQTGELIVNRFNPMTMKPEEEKTKVPSAEHETFAKNMFDGKHYYELDPEQQSKVNEVVREEKTGLGMSAVQYMKSHPGVPFHQALEQVKADQVTAITKARMEASIDIKQENLKKNYTPDVIANLANEYRSGTPLNQMMLPKVFEDPTGYVKSQVLTQALQQAREAGDTDWLRGHASLIYNANKSAVTQLNNKVTGLSNFEKRTEAEMSRVLKLSKDVPRREMSIENYGMWLNGKFKGDAKTINLFNGIKSISTEYARVISGNTGAGATSVHATEMAESMIPMFLGQKSLEDVVGSLRQNMEVTIGAAKEDLTSLRQNLNASKLSGEQMKKPEVNIITTPDGSHWQVNADGTRTKVK